MLFSFFFSPRTNKLSCLHSPVVSPRTRGGWLCKLGLTETGHSQSVLAVCFWFAILNRFDCCNGALTATAEGFLLQGELARPVYIYGRRPGGHIWELQCWLWKPRGHLFLMQAKESRMPIGGWWGCQNVPIEFLPESPSHFNNGHKGEKKKRDRPSRAAFHSILTASLL